MLQPFNIFDGQSYEQCDGAAMGSSLGPRLANVFKCVILRTFGWKTLLLI